MWLFYRKNLLHLIIQLALLLAIIVVALLARFLTACIASYQACVYFLVCITLPIQEVMASYQDDKPLSSQDDGSSLFRDDGPSSSQDGGPSSFQERFNSSLEDEYSSEYKEVEKVI